MNYLYFAIFSTLPDGRIDVTFPDLAPHAATFGEDLAEALHMAKDALEGYLLTLEDFKEVIPTPSNQEVFSITSNQLLIPIEVDTKIARLREHSHFVKKTLTIPSYLNDLGIQRGINFSAALTDALKERLEV